MTESNSNIGMKICSYNMHGLMNGHPMLKVLFDTHDIILVQEHWLQDSELHKINTINPNFDCFSLSSMTQKLSAGILIDRPFGGGGPFCGRNFIKKNAFFRT